MASVVTAGVIGLAAGGIVRHLAADHFDNCDITSDNQAQYDAGFAAATACDITSDNQAQYDAGFAAGQSNNSNKCKFKLDKNQPSTSVSSSSGTTWSDWSYGSLSEYTLKRDEINQKWVGASGTMNGEYNPSQYRIKVTPYDNNFKCCFQTTTSTDTTNPTSWQTEEKCYTNTSTFTSSQNSSAVFVSMYSKKK